MSFTTIAIRNVARRCLYQRLQISLQPRIEETRHKLLPLRRYTDKCSGEDSLVPKQMNQERNLDIDMIKLINLLEGPDVLDKSAKKKSKQKKVLDSTTASQNLERSDVDIIELVNLLEGPAASGKKWNDPSSLESPTKSRQQGASDVAPKYPEVEDLKISLLENFDVLNVTETLTQRHAQGLEIEKLLDAMLSELKRTSRFAEALALIEAVAHKQLPMLPETRLQFFRNFRDKSRKKQNIPSDLLISSYSFIALMFEKEYEMTLKEYHYVQHFAANVGNIKLAKACLSHLKESEDWRVSSRRLLIIAHDNEARNSGKYENWLSYVECFNGYINDIVDFGDKRMDNIRRIHEFVGYGLQCDDAQTIREVLERIPDVSVREESLAYLDDEQQQQQQQQQQQRR